MGNGRFAAEDAVRRKNERGEAAELASGRDAGTVLSGVGGLYTIRLDSGESVVCPARGKFRHEGESPYPGDRVTVSRSGGAHAIDEILARKNRLIRPTVANVTHLVAVVPACRPKPDTLTVDKLIAAAEDADIVPVIAVNKRDLDPVESARLTAIYKKSGFAVFELSAESGDGVDALGDYLANAECGASDASGESAATRENGDTYGESNGENGKSDGEKGAKDGANIKHGEKTLVVFSGASGAGKSTLMTRLFPSLDLKTGAVSRKSERGRHTTRTAQLFDMGTLYVADTPGFTMLDFARFNFIPTENLAFSFREFLPYVGKCRYTKCTHTKEEGCAILAAVADGAITRERHENYAAIRAEMLRTPDWARRGRSR